MILFKSKQQALRLVDQRFFRYWQAFYLAFYSHKLYIDVAKRWRGTGAFYLLLLLALLAIPFSIQNMLRFQQYTYNDFIKPFLQIPPIQIQQGKAVFDLPMPYFIKNQQNQVVVIIDTTGKVTDFSDEYPDLIGLLTEKNIYFREPISPFLKENPHYQSIILPPMKVETFAFNQLQDGRFDLKKWILHSGLILIKNSLIVSIYPFIVLSFFGLILTMILALAVMGQISAYAIFRFKLNYMAACRLMMVASTSSISIFFFLKTFDYNISSMSLCCTLLSYAYFCYGVWVVKQNSQALVHV